MKLITTLTRKSAFTLIELLAVIAIIAILAALSFPAIQHALMKARMIATLNNGRAIYQSLLTVDVRDFSALPASSGPDAFDNSTDYFKWATTNQYVDVTFDAFSAHGLDAYAGMDPDQFTSDMNAWCVVADLGEVDRPMIPAMFTRNLEISALSDPMEDALTDHHPFGKRGVIAVFRDARGAIYKQPDIIEFFNPAEATNAVLRP